MLFGKAFGHLLHKSLHYSHKILLPKKIPFSFVIDRKAATTTTHSSSAAKLVKAIRVHQFGGTEVPEYEDVPLGELKDGEIRVKNKAIGLNFVDVQTRKREREFKASGMPFLPGIGAAGVVTEVGPRVLWRKVGDNVAYAVTPMGAYAEEHILPAEEVVPVPPSMDPTVAASIMIEGMSAHYLLCRYMNITAGHHILINGATSRFGSVLCQWASSDDTTVTGIVSTKEEAAQAYENGCRDVIVTEEGDVVKRLKEASRPYGCHVVYDFVGGEDTFEGALACLMNWAFMVIIGQPDVPNAYQLAGLAAKSIFLVKPNLLYYADTEDELCAAAEEVFEKVELGKLKVPVADVEYRKILIP